MAIAVTLSGVSIPRRDVANISIKRGRDGELDRTGTGTATVSVNIVEGRANAVADVAAGGAATIELLNPVTSEYVSIFDGFVDRASYVVSPSLVVTRATFELVDGLDMLARAEIAPSAVGDPAPPFGYELPAGYAGQVFYEDAGQVKLRMEKVLLEAGWPTAKQRLATGNVSIQETFYPARTNLLQIIQDAADAEFPGLGNFYVDKFGWMRFRGRLARFNPDDPQYDVLRFPAGASTAGRAQIRGFEYSDGRDRLINSALCTPRGIREEKVKDQLVVDQASIDAYGVYSWSAEDLLTETGYLATPNNNAVQETRAISEYYVANYAEPVPRVDRLVFKSLRPDDYRADATWDLLCNVDLTDIVEVLLDAPGTAFDADYFVEGLTYSIRPGPPDFAIVELTCDLSPRAYFETSPW